ncbi:MAG TPA: biotin--[acetyl-CoA-carboxylase] ligase, partial [Phenylobacterium sp.]|nr:biotin--[acetyl-CoA-carboxylase] ligase [Phenylobacterium sp.]
MAAPPPAPEDALLILADAFARWEAAWLSGGFPAIAEAWARRAHGMGQACVARLPTETIEGIAEGMDPDGALRLRLPGGEVRRITAGDVFFGDA